MRIFLLANNSVGYEVCKYLKERGETIVGLGVHDKLKQKFTNEIITTAGVSKKYIFYPHDLRNNSKLTIIKNLKPDIIIAAFWGYILKKELLAIPSSGAINFHPGYLPYNRGMNPNVWPFIENTPAGVTIHYIDEGIDTGDIIAREKVKIFPTDTAGDIYDKTLIEIVELFKKIWPNIATGKNMRKSQSLYNEKSTFHKATDISYFDKIDLHKTYTGGELIKLLRARTYKDRYFSYYEEDGEKIYIKVQLSKKNMDSIITSTSFQRTVENILFSLKTDTNIQVPSSMTTILSNGKFLKIYAITNKFLLKRETIKLLATWREKADMWFPAQFPVTIDGTKKWAIDQLQNKSDRILFFLKLQGQKKPFAHIGLYRFNYKEKSCELDNIIRGEHSIDTKGAITESLKLLINWTRTYLRIKKIYLQVFSDNTAAINVYTKLGFKEIHREPLISIHDGNVIKWISAPSDIVQGKIKRYFIKMSLNYYA